MTTSSEQLSQKEIDLLFGGSAEAEPGRAERKRPSSDVQVYDFRRPNRISKDRLRSLEAMYGVLVKSLENWLTGRVRSQIELQLIGVEQFTYGEFLLSLSTPCSSYIYDIADTGGQQAVVDFGRDLSYFLVDRLLGGSGAPGVLDRPLSLLERMIVRIVADRAAAQLCEVWQDHVRLVLEFGRFEAIPDMLQAANREDPVLVANIEVRANGLDSLLLLCLPFNVLEKFFTSGGARRFQAGRGSARDRVADRSGVATSLRGAKLPVSVRMPELRLTLAELAGLRPGSVIPTGAQPQDPVDVRVAGRKRFRGAVGKIGRKVSVRIQDTVDPGEIDLVSLATEGANR